MTAVAVAGALANKPWNGGEAWVRLSWVRGLQALGLDVVFLEELDSAACRDAEGRPANVASSRNLEFWDFVIAESGLTSHAALIIDGGATVIGMSREELMERLSSAALLCNISGHLRTRDLLDAPAVRAFVDLDPGFTQFWAQQGVEVGLEGHDLYYSVGENIGQPGCPVPTLGLTWRPLPPFSVLDDWPRTDTPDRDRLTTVTSWRSYGRVETADGAFSSKHHQFRRFAAVAPEVPQQLEVAVDIHPADNADRELLAHHGWVLVPPAEVASTPHAFRHYVQHSGGEFSVAQGIYVETGSGWFSDRTVRYLSSGLPALVQDTGLAQRYPMGAGLISFRTPQEAVEAARLVAADYDHHRAAARALAEKFFDAATVLRRLLADANVPVGPCENA